MRDSSCRAPGAGELRRATRQASGRARAVKRPERAPGGHDGAGMGGSRNRRSVAKSPMCPDLLIKENKAMFSTCRMSRADYPSMLAITSSPPPRGVHVVPKSPPFRRSPHPRIARIEPAPRALVSGAPAHAITAPPAPTGGCT